MFNFKDIFTTLTILSGYLSVILASAGNIPLASALVILGLVFDKLDGTVARLTKTSNRFGAEFDTIADLVIYSIAPGFITFYALKELNLHAAAAAGFAPLIFGAVRLARFNIKRIEYPGFWFGLPRFGSAIAIAALFNLGLPHTIPVYISEITVVMVLSALNITTVPYFGHHNRKLTPFFKASFALLSAVLIISVFFGYAWRLLFLYVLYYIISPVFYPGRDERLKLKYFVNQWKKEDKH